MKLSPDQPLDLQEILQDLDQYRPKRKGWSWRHRIADQQIGSFAYQDTTENLRHSVPLLCAHAFGGIDPHTISL